MQLTVCAILQLSITRQSRAAENSITENRISYKNRTEQCSAQQNTRQHTTAQHSTPQHNTAHHSITDQGTNTSTVAFRLSKCSANFTQNGIFLHAFPLFLPHTAQQLLISAYRFSVPFFVHPSVRFIARTYNRPSVRSFLGDGRIISHITQTAMAHKKTKQT